MSILRSIKIYRGCKLLGVVLGSDLDAVSVLYERVHFVLWGNTYFEVNLCCGGNTSKVRFNERAAFLCMIFRILMFLYFVLVK